MVRKPNLKAERRKFRARLPAWVAAALNWLHKSSPWLRWPVAVVLIIGGVLGFLPLLGFWMIPLGLLLIVQDIPLLQPPLARLFAYVQKKWPA
jgi:hypothetical protein